MTGTVIVTGGNRGIGRSITEVSKAYEELSEMLKNNGPTPSEPFDELYILQPVSDSKNRHASILLPIEATLAAFQKIED